jgi:aerotaxis receptor
MDTEKNLKESHFGFNELFFSRTDEAGNVLSGNTIFKRVSEYEWNELLNQAHSIIRHGDMPRGVFHLFWDTVKSGQPIGAYVKNKSKSGKYYWVFALAFPIKGGYLSVRMKPSGKFFPIVQKEYQKLLDGELHNKNSPKNSHEVLLKDLNGLGFPNYKSFMVPALMDELESRQKQLHLPPIEVLEKLRELLESGNSIFTRASQGVVPVQ